MKYDKVLDYFLGRMIDNQLAQNPEANNDIDLLQVAESEFGMDESTFNDLLERLIYDQYIKFSSKKTLKEYDKLGMIINHLPKTFYRVTTDGVRYHQNGGYSIDSERDLLEIKKLRLSINDLKNEVGIQKHKIEEVRSTTERNKTYVIIAILTFFLYLISFLYSVFFK